MQNELLDLFTSFVNECKYSTRLRDETIRGYQAVFNLFIKIMPEITEIEFLTTPMLNEFFKRIQTRNRIVGRNTIKVGVKNSTIKTQWTKLNVFFTWLENKEHITINPLKDIRPPKVSYNDYRRIDESDINKLFSAVVNHTRNPLLFKRDTMMLSLLIHTGIRRGEFISLQVRDIDFTNNLITIRGETSKSGITRMIPMHPTLKHHINEYLRERNRLGYRTEFLIASSVNDRGLTLEGLKHWTNRMVEISGVNFHLHKFRHSFACELSEKGISIFALQKLMGHSDIRMTSKYTRSLKAEDMMNEIMKINV
jgi:integrase/recombinase XerD